MSFFSFVIMLGVYSIYLQFCHCDDNISLSNQNKKRNLSNSLLKHFMNRFFVFNFSFFFGNNGMLKWCMGHEVIFFLLFKGTNHPTIVESTILIFFANFELKITFIESINFTEKLKLMIQLTSKSSLNT